MIGILVMKIVLHEAEQQDTVFVFTALRVPPLNDYLSLTLPFPKDGSARAWIYRSFGVNTSFEIVPEGFEVTAPS